MCGFAGEFVYAGRADLAVVSAMAARLSHRGPDEAGAALSSDGRCGLAFRRLSIIDLELSHQPLTYAGPGQTGAATVVFNGEIYNFQSLRHDLAAGGFAFKTKGDTEVLPAMYLRDGPAAMLPRLEGMFAFAIYDHRAGRLMLARDRLGKKPLWYAALPDRIVFASEAKALLAHPLVGREGDPAALCYYLTLGYVPAPRSIWKGIVKLAPGHWLEITDRPGEPCRYWSPPEETARISQNDAVEAVRSSLQEAVAKRMIADVPLGALLSGGVDSSIVAAMMSRQAGRAGGVKTFTAGFADEQFDERPAAAAVAAHLGCENLPLVVESGDVSLLLDRLVAQYDEPFADSSALPTYLVCQAARQHVKVVLTGDGGDEAFAGYDRYRAMEIGQRMGPGKWLLAKLAGSFAAAFAPQDERNKLRRLARFAEALDMPPAQRYLYYRRLFWPPQLEALLERDLLAAADIARPEQWFTELYEGEPGNADLRIGSPSSPSFDNEIAYAQRHDLLTYLPDDLLVKVDIASMAHGLEVRCPLLDHRVVELGLGLPTECKFAGRYGKAILRRAFADLLPPETFHRPKRGFGAPIDRWLRGDLLHELRETLLDGPLVTQSWMVRDQLSLLIDQHTHRLADHRHRLWALLWLARWMEISK